jgi:hypothetical protein
VVVVLAAVCGLPVIAGLIGTVVLVVPQMQERQRRLTCQVNLQSLTAQWVAWNATQGDRPPPPGHLFIALRKQGVLGPSADALLRCPGDPGTPPPGGIPWESVDPERPPLGLCSYAVRDFARYPLDPAAAVHEVLAVCTSHGSAVVAAFVDGSVRVLDAENDLYLPPGTPLTVGPGSQVEQFRALLFFDGR